MKMNSHNVVSVGSYKQNFYSYTKPQFLLCIYNLPTVIVSVSNSLFWDLECRPFFTVGKIVTMNVIFLLYKAINQ